jgi:toxin ParE1/3/4
LPRVRNTVLAENDLTDIWVHIASDNPVAADALLDRIGEQCAMLAANPKAGRARPELFAELRSFPVGSYLILYRPEPGGIEVVRVLHGSRDLPQQFPDEGGELG